MSSTKFFHPYLEDKKVRPYGEKSRPRAQATLRRSGAGVYFIHQKNWLGEFKLVYIGFAGNDVKATLYRHFQKWVDKRSPDTKRTQRIERVSYAGDGFRNSDFKCRVIFCNSAAQAERFERALIRKFTPRDNSQKIALDSEADYRKALEQIAKADTKEIEPLDELPF